MAPKPVKRAAPAAAEISQPVKVAKTISILTDLVETVQKLPEYCKVAVVSTLPGSSSQHDAESIVVRMAVDVIEQIKPRMQKEIQERENTIIEAEEKKSKFQFAATEAETAHASHMEITRSREEAVEKASAISVEKSVALEGARVAQRQVDNSLKASIEEKTAYMRVVEEHVTALCQNALSCADFKEHLGVVVPLVEKIDLDQSMVAALPSTFAKAPTERGPFDKIVIDQLHDLFSEHIASLAKKISLLEIEVVEAATAVDAATVDLSAAKEAEQSVSLELTQARAAESEALTVLATVRTAITSTIAESKHAEKVRDEKVRALKSFENWSAKCFAEFITTVDAADV